MRVIYIIYDKLSARARASSLTNDFFLGRDDG